MLDVVAWLAQSGSAFVLKVASSIDDVVWFAAFLHGQLSVRERVKNAAVYAAVCLAQTVLAWVIATSGAAAVDRLTHGGLPGFSTERLLTLVAALGLSAYSLKLLVEELSERYGGGDGDAVPLGELVKRVSSDVAAKAAAAPRRLLARDDGFIGVSVVDDDDGDGGGAGEAAVGTAVETAVEAAAEAAADDGAAAGAGVELRALETVDLDGDGAPAAGDVEAPGGGADGARATTTATLLVVAFCGSLDDLTLFVPMLAGGAIGPLALLAGAAAATALIVAICVFLNFFRAISDRLAAVPLVCVTSAFATFLIAKVALMR